ncbi:MAG: response regulator transcription factor [Acutalibacteraceae bacterium]|jgi:two-component system alkaline phosphatase synthesis response regulator PhoP
MIYIVEDDINIRQLQAYALKNSGYEVAECDNAKQLFALCEERIPRLIVLDIMLPDQDGISILKRLKSDHKTKDVPVVMVTAKSSELDTVKGLDAGADDYLSKPFGVMEFISRVKAVLRRTGSTAQPLIYKASGIELDDEKHLVLANGNVCECTYKEYELLKYLLVNKGIVLSREKIMSKVWDTDFEGESRTVDMHIKTLRQKLGECGSAIKTVRNVGYKIDKE